MKRSTAISDLKQSYDTAHAVRPSLALDYYPQVSALLDELEEGLGPVAGDTVRAYNALRTRLFQVTQR